MKWFPSHLLDNNPKTVTNSNPSIQPQKRTIKCLIWQVGS